MKQSLGNAVFLACLLVSLWLTRQASQGFYVMGGVGLLLLGYLARYLAIHADAGRPIPLKKPAKWLDEI